MTAQPVGPREPADPAPERQRDDTDIRRGPRWGGQTVRRRRVQQVAPRRSCLHPRHAPSGVDLNPAHQVGAQQDALLERTDAPRTVADALGRDPQILLGGKSHDLRHIGGTSRSCYQRWALVDREIPSGPGGVVARVARDVDVSGDGRSESSQLNAL